MVFTTQTPLQTTQRMPVENAFQTETHSFNPISQFAEPDSSPVNHCTQRNIAQQTCPLFRPYHPQ